MIYTDGFHVCADRNAELVNFMFQCKIPMKHLIRNVYHHAVCSINQFPEIGKMVEEGKVKLMNEANYYQTYKKKYNAQE